MMRLRVKINCEVCNERLTREQIKKYKEIHFYDGELVPLYSIKPILCEECEDIYDSSSGSDR